MFLLDRFFDGTFLTFGIEVISFADRDQEDRIDPMVYIFPRSGRGFVVSPANPCVYIQSKCKSKKDCQKIVIPFSLLKTRSDFSEIQIIYIREFILRLIRPEI